VLIPSSRHKPEDLALWREYEEADAVYARTRLSRLDWLAEQSIDIITQWAGDGAGYIGTSWGKDSVVLMHLCRLARVDVPAVYARKTRRDNPDCDLVRDAFAPTNYHELTFSDEQCARGEHWRTCDDRFGPRRLTGLRMDESGTRAMSVRHLGIDTGRSCRPLARWTIADVFAWLYLHGLPVHPAYACLGGGRWPRQHIRVHSLGGSRGANRGRREWEREYYANGVPEDLRVQEFPEVTP
jgi:phosphoadenosine phosphosulfate reductase